MQTILGSGGIIGKELSKELPKYTDKIRQVSRNPKKYNENDEIFPGDLTNPVHVNEAVKGSEIAYLAAGLPYDVKIWRRDWPIIMRNVINACKTHNVKLVFFDNVYMLGKVDGWMTESTPMNPSSNKGEVRKQLDTMLLEEIKQGNIEAIIARAADFYGPGAVNTFAHMMIFEKLKQGKKASWMINDTTKHSFTYTPDAGRATALLGNTPEAYNRVWHLPTDKNVLNGKEFIEEASKAFGTEANYNTLSLFMIKLAGIFSKTIRETVELAYQHQYDYLFDGSDFENKFFKATTYERGLEETAGSYK